MEKCIWEDLDKIFIPELPEKKKTLQPMIHERLQPVIREESSALDTGLPEKELAQAPASWIEENLAQYGEDPEQEQPEDQIPALPDMSQEEIVIAEVSESEEKPQTSHHRISGAGWFLRHLNTGIAIRIPAQGLVIGSSPRSDYVIEFDGQISKTHVSIRPENGQIVVEDLSSTNGSFIEYEQIDSPCLLLEDQLLRLGMNQIFEVRRYEEEEA